MPTGRIPFVDRQRSGLESLAGGSPVAHNVVVDETGAAMRRPGLQVYSGATDSVVDSDGIGAITTTPDGKLWAVGGGALKANLYRVTSTGARMLTGRSPQLALASGSRPVLAKTEGLIVIAAGSRPQKIVLATEESAKLGGAPPRSTHIAAQSSRLISNNTDVQSRVNYSGIATGGATSGHEDWTAGSGTGGFFSAEARPDPVVAVAENTNELWVWGTTSVQVFVPDPQAVFAAATTREYGLLAPYSVINRDQQFAWFDHRRRFVVSDGRTYEVISTPIQRTLDELTIVTDCFGYRVHLGPVDVLVWTFPTDGRTFVFQSGLWGQWSGWDGNWTAFPALCHYQDPNTGKNLVGDGDGKISELSLSSETDRGSTIRAYVQTGFLNRDTDKVKHCQAVHIAMRRGETTGDTAPQAWVGFRDAPGASWRRIPVSLGSVGQREPVVTLRSLGTYRRREWYFEFSGSEQLALASATEEYEVGDT